MKKEAFSRSTDAIYAVYGASGCGRGIMPLARAQLQAAGVAADKVELKKPEQAKADGPASEARRVEVSVQ